MNTSNRLPEKVRFRFQKLEAWQDARRLNLEACRLSQSFPVSEQFALTPQVRRASVSIAANIAEGSGRNPDRDFAHFREQSYASAMELAPHLFLASDLARGVGERPEPGRSDGNSDCGAEPLPEYQKLESEALDAFDFRPFDLRPE